MYVWWYRQGGSEPIDKRGLYLADNINARYDAHALLIYIREYAHQLTIAKESANEQAN